MKSDLGKLEDHYIVCGNGRVGRTVSTYLDRRNLHFCVIEIDPAAEPELRRLHYRYVIGDAAEDENLTLAGLARAKAVFALLPSDADNLYLTLSAKGLNPSVVVVARASGRGAETKLERAGADHVVSPYELVGLRLLQKVLSPTLLEFMDLVIRREHLELIMEEFRVASDSALAGRSIEEARIRSRYGLIIVAIKRPQVPLVFNPGAGEKIGAGDVLVVLGPEDRVKELE
jgi:voltage-gated potassium channel